MLPTLDRCTPLPLRNPRDSIADSHRHQRLGARLPKALGAPAPASLIASSSIVAVANGQAEVWLRRETHDDLDRLEVAEARLAVRTA